MKFGRNLPRNQVPEWSAEYINYKGLKKLVKSASDDAKEGEEADLAGAYHVTSTNPHESADKVQASSSVWIAISKQSTASTTESTQKLHDDSVFCPIAMVPVQTQTNLISTTSMIWSPLSSS